MQTCLPRVDNCFCSHCEDMDEKYRNVTNAYKNLNELVDKLIMALEMYDSELDDSLKLDYLNTLANLKTITTLFTSNIISKPEDYVSMNDEYKRDMAKFYKIMSEY